MRKQFYKEIMINIIETCLCEIDDYNVKINTKQCCTNNTDCINNIQLAFEAVCQTLYNHF